MPRRRAVAAASGDAILERVALEVLGRASGGLNEYAIVSRISTVQLLHRFIKQRAIGALIIDVDDFSTEEEIDR
jgi:hypothetical protein